MTSRQLGRALVLALALLGCAGGGGAGENSSGGEAGECDEARPCGAGERCVSPEQHAWNRCEERSRVRCATGEVGDDCGNCFASCLSDADCPEGKRCNGAYCESPKQCFGP